MSPASGSAPSPDRVLDPGLQLERTTLAWDRTALALLVNGLLLVRLGAGGAGRIAGFVVVGAAAVPVVLARTRYLRRDAALRQGGSGRSPVAVGVVGVAAVAVSLIGLWAVVRVAVAVAG